MDIINRKLLEKLKRKNKGNVTLIFAVELLLNELEANEIKNQDERLKVRTDGDCVHSGEFYFLDINIHRSFVLIEFEENGDITIVWCGTHDEYENTFKNNKNTNRKWLKERELIN